MDGEEVRGSPCTRSMVWGAVDDAHVVVRNDAGVVELGRR